MDYRAYIKMSKRELDTVNSYFKMTAEELRDKYDLQYGDSLVYSAKFEDEFEAEIRIVMCHEDSPYIEPVLYDDSGSELLIVNKPQDGPLKSEYHFEVIINGYDNDHYYLTIEQYTLQKRRNLLESVGF